MIEVIIKTQPRFRNVKAFFIKKCYCVMSLRCANFEKKNRFDFFMQNNRNILNFQVRFSNVSLYFRSNMIIGYYYFYK